MTKWNNELEKKILKKSRFTLTFRIIRILVVVFFLYAIAMIVINITADRLHYGNENTFYSKLALKWTVPNVRGEFYFDDEGTNVFGTKHITYNLTKRVGDEEVFIGEATVTNRLLPFLSSIRYSHPGLEQLTEFSFSLPEDPRTGRVLAAERERGVWDTLEKLPEGTVGELAFSTTSFIKPEQLIDELQAYDVHVLWMPLYTGEFVEHDPDGWSGSDDIIKVSDVIGLTGGDEPDDDFYGGSRYTLLDETTISDSEQTMLRNIGELLNKSERYYEQFLGLRNLEEKYQYLKKEGFTVYGAVVTGPVKELLQLQDLPFIQGEQLGEVELWNWEIED